MGPGVIFSRSGGNRSGRVRRESERPGRVPVRGEEGCAFPNQIGVIQLTPVFPVEFAPLVSGFGSKWIITNPFKSLLQRFPSALPLHLESR